MSRNMKRIRRRDLYQSDGEGIIDYAYMRQTPRNLVFQTNCNGGNGFGMCPPTLAQRVNCLENEVGDINIVLAEQTCRLNRHEKQIKELECRYPPYWPCPPVCNPCPPVCNPCPPVCNPCNPCNPCEPCNPCDPCPPVCNPCKPCPPPCPPPCKPCLPPKPPIVFDGYSISFRLVYINNIPAAFWFLIPERPHCGDVYRFSFKASVCKYLYEPVCSSNYGFVFPPNEKDGEHVTYIYENIPGYGWGLRQYLYIDKVKKPKTAIGYQYTAVAFTNPCGTEWSYVPNCSPCPPCPPCNPCNPCQPPCPPACCQKCGRNPCCCCLKCNKSPCCCCPSCDSFPCRCNNFSPCRVCFKNPCCCNPCPPVCSPVCPPACPPRKYYRKVTLRYPPVTEEVGSIIYYNTVNTNEIDPDTNVTKLPNSITS